MTELWLHEARRKRRTGELGRGLLLRGRTFGKASVCCELSPSFLPRPYKNHSLFLLPLVPLLGPGGRRDINLELFRDRGRSARCYGRHISSCGSSGRLFFCKTARVSSWLWVEKTVAWTRRDWGWGPEGESEIGNEELDSRPARNSLFWSFLAVLMEVCASARAERSEKSGRERKEEREGGRKR